MLSRGIGALEYIGGALDKPGAAVRGLLAGEPEQLLHAIPFSSTIAEAVGYDMPERVTGRDLLEQYGIAPLNKPGLSPFKEPEDAAWDIGGFALEVALDPLWLLSGPASAGVKSLAKGSKAFSATADVLGTAGKASKAGKAAEAALEAGKSAKLTASAVEAGATSTGVAEAKAAKAAKAAAEARAVKTPKFLRAFGKTAEEAEAALKAQAEKGGHILGDAFIKSEAAVPKTLKEAGEAVKQSYTEPLAENLAEGIRSGERAWASIQAPRWLQKAGLEGQLKIGTGETAAWLADVTNGLLHRGKTGWASRFMKQAFDPDMAGKGGEAVQRLRKMSAQRTRNMRRSLTDAAGVMHQSGRALDEQMSGLLQHLQDTGVVQGREFIENAYKAMREQHGALTPEGILPILARHTGEDADTIGRVIDAEATAKLGNDYFRTMADIEDVGASMLRDYGMAIGDLKDAFVPHMPRRLTDMARRMYTQGKGDASRRAMEHFEFGRARDDMLRHFPGGTGSINRLSMTPEITGMRPGPIAWNREARAVGKGAAVLDKTNSNGWGVVLRMDDVNKQAKVLSRDPETFKSVEHWVDTENLVARQKGVPEWITEHAHYEKMEPGEQLAAAKEYLANKGYTATDGVGRHTLEDARLDDALHEIMYNELWDELKLAGWTGEGELARSLGKSVKNLTEDELSTIRMPTGKQFALKDEAGKVVKDDAGNVIWEDEVATLDEFLETFITEPMGDAATGAIKPSLTQAGNFINFVKKYGQEFAHGGAFDRRVLEDHMSYVGSMMESLGTMMSAHNLLDDLIANKGIRQLGEDGLEKVTEMPLQKAWNDAGFTNKGLMKFLGKHFGDRDPDEMRAIMQGLVVDKKAGNALKVFREIQDPYKAGPIVKFLDKVTATYKGLLTSGGGPLWGPAFHTRNLMGGIWQSWSDGHVSLPELMAGYTRTHQNMIGKLAAGEDRFIREFVDNGGFTDGRGMIIDVLGEEAGEAVARRGEPKGALGGITEPLRGLFSNPKKAIQQRGWRVFDPTATRGGFGTPSGVLGETGERGYAFVEYLNRAGYYDALRRKGFKPGEAMELVKRSQFDYSELSPFMRNVGRRVVPFGTWISKNMPYQFAKIFEAPGGRAAQTVRFMNQDFGGDAYKPSYLKEGLAIHTGGDEREASFVKQAGLPIEDLNKIVIDKMGRPGMRTAEKFAAQLHPLINFPIESFANKQFFTGRDRDTLRSTTAAISKGLTGTPRPVPWADTAIHYSPFSRAASELQGFLDERKPWWQKAVNFMSGVKFTTQDVARQRLIDTTRALEEEVKDSPYVREGNYYYVPEYLKQYATSEPERIRQIGALQREQKELIEQGVKRRPSYHPSFTSR